eukprot:m.30973 g.30973  ORF g.30973 m.30973 type:complete len:91 (-) comp16374_c0_seq1:1302-1574(-)
MIIRVPELGVIVVCGVVNVVVNVVERVGAHDVVVAAAATAIVAVVVAVAAFSSVLCYFYEVVLPKKGWVSPSFACLIFVQRSRWGLVDQT